ncbi:flagellin [Halobiforma nitratireducens]|uniref:Flagellin n=1 Tax=Halobiforma nitratireducens JCM 10879 TaxID=1227454 RepID=M0LH46_9EURY|nr:flagellin [Halobiforma nitratireducens]EMA32403.1 flagellin [Halobiforma nitratireducens JCM 10879]
MASVSATHIILFVASMIVAAGIAGTVVMEVNQLSDAVETRGSNVAEEIETDIEITSDAGHVDALYEEDEETGEVTELTILVKNIGSGSLDATTSEVDILVDGRYVSSDYLEVQRVDVEDDSWRPGGVVEVTVDIENKGDVTVSGDTRVTAIVNGNEDSIDFHVPTEDGSE